MGELVPPVAESVAGTGQGPDPDQGLPASGEETEAQRGHLGHAGREGDEGADEGDDTADGHAPLAPSSRTSASARSRSAWLSRT